MSKSDSELVSEWLSQCRCEETKRIYTHGIMLFQKWYSKPLADFLALEPGEMRRQAVAFQNSLIQNGMKANTVISMLTALGSFCNNYDKPLRLGRKRVRPMIDLGSHVFTTGDLNKMLNAGNVEDKAILCTFASLGWEVSSIIKLNRVYVQNLIYKAQEDRRKFIYFINQREKTGIVRLGILNPTAIEWISEWLKTGLNEQCLFSIQSREGMNKLLKRLCRNAHVTVTGRVHTHLIRKWVMSGLSRAGFNEFQIKFVMGKSIALSDFTYLQTLQQEVEDRYPQAFKEYLDISGKHFEITEDEREGLEFVRAMNKVLKDHPEKQEKFLALLGSL